MVSIIADVAEKVQNKAKNDKTFIQKITDNIYKKENNTTDNIKDVINNIQIEDISNNLKLNKSINIDEITKSIINKRTSELKDIHQNGVLSKMLNKPSLNLVELGSKANADDKV